MDTNIIDQYTDLTPHQAMHLSHKTFKGPMTAAFLRDGLVTEDRQLTKAGCNALERYTALDNKMEPASPVSDLPPYTRLPKLPKPYQKLLSAHRKLLVALARPHGLAYKWICRIFGADVLNTLKDAGLVKGDSVRGAPQSLTDDGQQVVKQALSDNSKGGGD